MKSLLVLSKPKRRRAKAKRPVVPVKIVVSPEPSIRDMKRFIPGYMP